MSTPENTFIQSVHRHLPNELYRMKNHNQYNGGIPDVWYSGPRGDMWVEFKFVVLPKRDDTIVKIELSALQKNWLASRHAEGRCVGVMVGCREGGVWFAGLSWQDPLKAKVFRAFMRTRDELAAAITSLTI